MHDGLELIRNKQKSCPMPLCEPIHSPIDKLMANGYTLKSYYCFYMCEGTADVCLFSKQTEVSSL